MNRGGGTAAAGQGPGWKSSGLLACLALFTLLGLFTCAVLVPQWRHNPDLTHGLFMPVLFGMLVHEGLQGSNRRLVRGSRWTSIAMQGLALAGILFIAIGSLYALALGWNHNLSCLALVCSFASFGLALLLFLSRDDVALLSFSWPVLAALLLCLLCAPMPPGLWAKFTLRLQTGVTTSVLETLHILGIPAAQHGNIIELANASVGVEEACSGVRSLVSCFSTAVFFSAYLVRRLPGRIAVILLSVPLALGMNYLRSLLLTLLANRGVRIEGFWHDFTGFAILGVTALLLGAIAVMFSRGEQAKPQTAPAKPSSPALGRPRPAFIGACLVVALLIGFTLSLWPYLSKPQVQEPPQLEALLPSSSPGWKVIPAPDMLRFSEVLQTNRLVQRDYLRTDEKGATQITIYLAYWMPGQSNPSQVAIHTPDGCWPGAGWSRLDFSPARGTLVSGSRRLPAAEQRLFVSQDGFMQYVWYWHLYGGKPIVQLNPYKVDELLHMALRFGFNRSGDQLFVRISSNRPWNEIASDPLLVQLFEGLKTQGL